MAAVTCPLRRLLLTGRVGHPRRHLIRDLSLAGSAQRRGGDTRERYESVLILYASCTDRFTEHKRFPAGLLKFHILFEKPENPWRIVYLR